MDLIEGPICVPGSRLSSTQKHIAGHGTYESGGYIYAAFAGIVKETDKEECEEHTKENIKKETNEESNTNKKIVTVLSPRDSMIIPKKGDIVTAKVTVVNSRQVNCVIICVGHSVLGRTYRGIIKKEEIRATDRDRVDPYKCFRPGDVILAKVLPITDIYCYHLTTAENELGVAIAKAEGSPQGVNMVPLSWIEMQCPKTFVKEARKVAQVLPENLDDLLASNKKVKTYLRFYFYGYLYLN